MKWKIHFVSIYSIHSFHFRRKWIARRRHLVQSYCTDTHTYVDDDDDKSMTTASAMPESGGDGAVPLLHVIIHLYIVILLLLLSFACSPLNVLFCFTECATRSRISSPLHACKYDKRSYVPDDDWYGMPDRNGHRLLPTTQSKSNGQQQQQRRKL